MKRSGQRIRVWEKISDLHRYDFARIEDIKETDNSVVLRPVGENGFSIQETDFLYMHSFHRTTLFKTEVIAASPEKLEIRKPQFVKIEEGRSEERKYYGLNGHFGVTFFHPTSNKNFNGRICDSSEHGLAVIIDKFTFDHLLEGDEIYLGTCALDNFKGKKAVVRHITPYDKVACKTQTFKIGLEILWD